MMLAGIPVEAGSTVELAQMVRAAGADVWPTGSSVPLDDDVKLPALSGWRAALDRTALVLARSNPAPVGNMVVLLRLVVFDPRGGDTHCGQLVRRWAAVSLE